MNNKAQAGLEYLLTYGWALILVATIIVVLVFVVGGKPGGVVFNVSDPTKFLLKASNVSDGKANIVLQNATGGRITINNITVGGDFDLVSTLNGQPVSTPIGIIAGGEMRFEGVACMTSDCSNAGEIKIDYTDASNLPRSVFVKSSGGAGGGAP